MLFSVGAWQRRWIADDGLIVLRTVRNLLAGNGPVFNAGERVEANTSTAWTYLVCVLQLAHAGPARVRGARRRAGCSRCCAIVFAHARRRAGCGAAPGAALLLPAGVLVYIALPPARDYATSGSGERSGHLLAGAAVVATVALDSDRRG